MVPQVKKWRTEISKRWRASDFTQKNNTTITKLHFFKGKKNTSLNDITRHTNQDFKNMRTIMFDNILHSKRSDISPRRCFLRRRNSRTAAAAFSWLRWYCFTSSVLSGNVDSVHLIVIRTTFSFYHAWHLHILLQYTVPQHYLTAFVLFF